MTLRVDTISVFDPKANEKMKSLKAALLLLVTITTVLVFTAFDAAAQKKAEVQETYAATDGPSTPEELPELPEAPGTPEVEAAPVEVTSSVEVKTQVSSPHITKVTVKKKKGKLVKLDKIEKKLAPNQKLVTYDTVPLNQSAAMVQRLKLVEDIIRVYGRAYDYRAYTLAELQEIQTHLQTSTLPQPVEQARREMNPEE
jgi:hypothetical protein